DNLSLLVMRRTAGFLTTGPTIRHTIEVKHHRDHRGAFLLQQCQQVFLSTAVVANTSLVAGLADKTRAQIDTPCAEPRGQDFPNEGLFCLSFDDGDDPTHEQGPHRTLAFATTRRDCILPRARRATLARSSAETATHPPCGRSPRCLEAQTH